MKPLGTLIGTAPALAGGPAYHAAWGIDFSAVTFSGGLIRSSAFNVDLNGSVNASAGSFTSGLSLGSTAVAGSTDLSKHLALYGTTYGLNVTPGAINVVVGGAAIGTFSGGLNAVIGAVTPAVGTFTTLNASAGVHCGSVTASVRTDLSHHLDLYGGQYGMNVMNSGNLAIAFPSSAGVEFSAGTTFVGNVTTTGLNYMAIGVTMAASTGNFTQVAVNAAKSSARRSLDGERPLARHASRTSPAPRQLWCNARMPSRRSSQT